MPLPPALAARLLKRGIVPDKAKDAKSKKKHSSEEEVFAESYDKADSDDESDASGPENDDSKSLECPNKSNPYHECTSYCRNKFGSKKFDPDTVIEKRRLRMLKIYPLLPNWVEVPDFSSNRYYYWNVETDQVCWLSPSHPKAKYESVKNQKTPTTTDKTKKSLSFISVSKTSNKIKEAKENLEEIDEELKEVDELLNAYERESKKKPVSQPPKQPYHHNPRKNKSDGKLDPMDPSSYSDVPR